MKKYLFLLFLIGVYVLILFNNKDNKTSNVVSYLDKNRDGAISVKINFKDGINSNNNQPSTWWLRNMSFLRLKNIELGYSLPKNLWRNTTVISGIRFFVRGTNLLTFSKFDLWDPEVENTTGAAYPIMKSLSAGFEIKF